MPQVNRRTVVRGAAWTVPVVAVASTAPAIASSLSAPRPSSVVGCRLTAGGSSNCYRFTLNFVRPTESWTVRLDSVFLVNTSTAGGEEVVNTTTPREFVVSSASAANTVALRACTTGTMQSDVKVRFTYTATSAGNVVETVVVTYDLDTSPCKN